MLLLNIWRQFTNKKIDLYSKVLGEGHSFVIKNLNKAANGEEYLGYFQESLVYRKKLFEIYNSKFPNSFEHANSLSYIARLHEKMKDYEQFMNYRKQAMEIYYPASRQEIQNIYEKQYQLGITPNMEEVERLRKYQIDAFQLSEELSISEPTYKMRLIDILATIGTIYKIKGNPKKCLEYYELALSDIQKIFEEGHPIVLPFLQNVISASLNIGDTDRALIVGEEALQICNKFFSLKGLETERAAKNMQAVYLKLGNHEKVVYYQELQMKAMFEGYLKIVKEEEKNKE